ncbi:MAG TPA: uroporphyrinogen-III synthase [Vicinamibacterales bacterium]|nr:uroporphyrinogen-III synthase [Vicinamibacterales bacterium]
MLSGVMPQATPSFDGLRVLALESRRAKEVSALVSTYGGQPLVVPALREIPLDSNRDVLQFSAALFRGDVDIVIFLTGVGTRALVRAIEGQYDRNRFIAALSETKVVARGPKPLAVLRELGVPVWIAVPEPNTWREVVSALDAAMSGVRPLDGTRVAVQEYGKSNVELLNALGQRGAQVLRVPVYLWALPEDVEPLKNAVLSIVRGEIDLVLFTTSVQVTHLWQIASEMSLDNQLRTRLASTVIASIGPTTSDELRRHELEPDLEASHGKMGLLVREAAERAKALLHAKRALP